MMVVVRMMMVVWKMVMMVVVVMSVVMTVTLVIPETPCHTRSLPSFISILRNKLSVILIGVYECHYCAHFFFSHVQLFPLVLAKCFGISIQLDLYYKTTHMHSPRKHPNAKERGSLCFATWQRACLKSEQD